MRRSTNSPASFSSAWREHRAGKLAQEKARARLERARDDSELERQAYRASAQRGAPSDPDGALERRRGLRRVS